MLNRESQSKTPPPESGRRTHLLCFTYSYCIMLRVDKLATSLLVLRQYKHLFLFSILRYEKTREFQTQLLHYFSNRDKKSNHHHTARVVVTRLLIFANYRRHALAYIC